MSGPWLFQRFGVTCGRSVDWIAASGCVTRKGNHVVSRPASRLIHRIVGAEDLGAARHHGIARGGVIDAGFLGVGVGACANEITLANERGDIVGGTVVALDEAASGWPGVELVKITRPRSEG